MKIALFNGAGQSDYLFGFVTGIVKTPVTKVDILDIDIISSLFKSFEKVEFHKVYTYHPNSSFFRKAYNLLSFYFLQSKFILIKKPRIIHFQWLDRNFFTDRVILPTLCRLRGHKVVLTVHNVNAGKRDRNDSYYNRFTLYLLYHLCNHLIVHTIKSKEELEEEFNIDKHKISIINHGMNNKVLIKDMNKQIAREYLNIGNSEKVILFFGNIDYYKGLDILIESFHFLPGKLNDEVRLIIAGNIKSKEYANLIYKQLESSSLKYKTLAHIRFINDEDIETYFAASDCIVLPYRDIYQSGVLFMAYSFGLPILATKVGNFEYDIIDGETGYLIESTSSFEVAKTIEKYFNSPIFNNLDQTRLSIKQWANKTYSWKTIGQETYMLYKKVLNHE